MSNSNLSALSMPELKTLAATNNVIPTGDKRSKQSWIDAIELFCACETVSDAEKEAKEIIDRLKELGNAPDNETDTEFEERSSEYIGLSEVLGDIQTEITAQKKGAAAVLGSLLCILILTIQTVLYIGCAIVQVAIHLKSLFGSYNPDYDLCYQLQILAEVRKPVLIPSPA